MRVTDPADEFGVVAVYEDPALAVDIDDIDDETIEELRRLLFGAPTTNDEDRSPEGNPVRARRSTMTCRARR